MAFIEHAFSPSYILDQSAGLSQSLKHLSLFKEICKCLVSGNLKIHVVLEQHMAESSLSASHDSHAMLKSMF